jgi:Ser/Thr protein kinase RdoA (MazF antagonist)
MSVEHPVDTPSLKERRTSLTHMAEWALSRYGLGDAQPVLLDDSTNMVFRILPLGQQRHAGGDVADIADNAGFVLRIHALGQHSTRAIHEELQWSLAVRRDTALIVPAPVPARDEPLIQEIPALGEPTPRQCVLFHWVSGDFRNDTLTPNDLQCVGAFMAQLHCHADQLVASQTPPPARRALFCDVHAWGDAPGKAAAHFSAEERAVFAAAAQRVHTTIQELGESRDVFGFIHADLHQWNYLFHGEEVRAIDFDDCGWGYYAYDMAVTFSYREAWATFPALQDAFLTGYQRVRPLPKRYVECLDVFLAARILVMVPWILSWPQPGHIAWGPRYLQQAVGRLRRFLER